MRRPLLLDDRSRASSVNLILDPRETRQVAEPFNGWTQFPMMEMLFEFQASVQRYPNIPMGASDDYAP